MRPGQKYVVGDATDLPFDDQSFDLVFSNSVIEHLGNFQKQAAFARESLRVGRGCWIQTPAREFPIEPHFITPFIHWFSIPMQKKLLRNFTLWGWLQRPAPSVIDSVLAELRLMSEPEVRHCFPGCILYTESFLGLPKSYTAYRHSPSTSTWPEERSCIFAEKC